MEATENTKEQQEFVLNGLERIVATAKDISDSDQTLGEILLFFVSQTMDLYENLVKQEQYNVRNLVQFVGKLYGMQERDILNKAYNSKQTQIHADDAIVDAIAQGSGMEDADLENYKEATAKLVSEFKAEAREVLGR